MVNKIVNYVKSSVEEMKKVSWPTKKQTYQYTLLVVGISVSMAAFLGTLDFIFNLGLEAILRNK
jgi:preprotein translocase subunit SecE